MLFIKSCESYSDSCSDGQLQNAYLMRRLGPYGGDEGVKDINNKGAKKQCYTTPTKVVT